MATNSTKKSTSSKTTKGKSPEEIYTGFQQLRNEQRSLGNKLSEVEMDLHEHVMVLDTLKDLDGDRKCYRLIGGVLCEKTVKDVIPTLTSNKDKLTNASKTLNDQITKKGIEINEYKDKYNIGVRGVDDPPSSSRDQTAESGTSSDPSAPRNVLVVNPV